MPERCLSNGLSSTAFSFLQNKEQILSSTDQNKSLSSPLLLWQTHCSKSKPQEADAVEWEDTELWLLHRPPTHVSCPTAGSWMQGSRERTSLKEPAGVLRPYCYDKSFIVTFFLSIATLLVSIPSDRAEAENKALTPTEGVRKWSLRHMTPDSLVSGAQQMSQIWPREHQGY